MGVGKFGSCQIRLSGVLCNLHPSTETPDFTKNDRAAEISCGTACLDALERHAFPRFILVGGWYITIFDG